MKISKVETIVLSIPFTYRGPGLHWGGKSWSAIDVLLVRVETDAGIVGWGETTFSSPRLACDLSGVTRAKFIV
jgi:L-alanine-DL-glutamate epimerase-like enolase superfamily enzyme